MPKNKKRNEPGLNMRAETNDPALNYRSATLSRQADGPASYDEESRSVEVVAATETPSLVYDWERGSIMEILLMSGAQIPETKQMVLLDAHQRYSTASVIGSVRDLRVDGDALVGRAYFSSVDEAQGPATKVKEGHLTDFSVGYRVLEAVWIPEGKTTIIDGREFKGPLQVTTKWQPRELSTVPIGADENAKARAAGINKDNKEETQMDKKLRAFLERSGLPTTATEDEAWAFLDKLGPHDEERQDIDVDTIRAEATGAERDRIREIDAMCEQFDCTDMVRGLIVGGKTTEESRTAVMAKLQERAKNPGFGGVQIIKEDREKFREAAQDALWLRAGYTVQTPRPGATELRGFTLVEMARECLRMAGIEHRGPAKEMVGRAMTSSDFPNILANLANRAMQAGWDGSAETWSTWCATGTVNDFKTHYDNRLSEFDDLEEVGESGEIKYGKFSEKSPETYKAATYAKKFRITRVMIVNDDLGAITEMPARRAEAASRKVGDVAYAVLTANGNMGDGYALFDATNHRNLATSGYLGAPGVSTIGEAIRAMGVQKDIAGKRRLNIRPEYFLGPKALEGVAEVFFKSDKFSDNSTVATDSSFASTRVNPYAGNYFTRVYEARLDDNDTTYWYLAGPKGKTIKVVFLNGQQGPILEVNQPGFSIEGLEYAVSIDVGAYAVDYRALYANPGE